MNVSAGEAGTAPDGKPSGKEGASCSVPTNILVSGQGQPVLSPARLGAGWGVGRNPTRGPMDLEGVPRVRREVGKAMRGQERARTRLSGQREGFAAAGFRAL